MGDLLVIVASPEKDCVAHRTLVAEGVPHDLLLCEQDTDYGDHLARLWRGGEGFVLFEWDVIPRPSVANRLARCRHDWCAWPYDDPNPNADEPVVSLGAMKFGTRLVRRYPDLPEYWEGVLWESVESNVYAALREVTGDPYPHLHGGGKYTKQGMIAKSPLAHRKAD